MATDASGVATSSKVTANGIAGTYAATASVPLAAASVSYTLTNVADVAPGAPIPALGPLGLLLLALGVGAGGWLARRRA